MRILSHTIFFLLLAFLVAAPALAVQQHGGAEGLISHQIGHILFILGMSFLLVHIYRLGMRGRGWRDFKFFLWLLILWNVITFSGHWMREYVDPLKFVMENEKTVAFSVSSFFDAFFYLTRLDHLFLVPSFLFLLLALMKWRRNP